MPLPRSSKWVSGRRPTTESGSNPKDELGMMKVPLDLVSDVALCIEALCMADGDEKYGPYNYRVSKVQAHIYLAAAQRHIMAVQSGEDFDLKTGKPHLGYARATLGIYLDAWVNGFLLDTRPLPSKAALLLNTFERTSGQSELTPGEVTERILQIVRLPQPQLLPPPTTETTHANAKAPTDPKRSRAKPKAKAKARNKGQHK